MLLPTRVVWLLVLLLASTAASGTCKSLFDSVEHAEIKVVEDPDTIKKSLPAITVSAVLWLSAMQFMRGGAELDVMDTLGKPAFLLTMSSDIGLTFMSHYAALVPGINKVFRGGLGKYDWPVRSLTLISMGTTAIVTSWYLAGIEVEMKHTCMAAGLCTVVYPPLIKMKQALHQKLPAMLDGLSVKKFTKKNRANSNITEFLSYVRRQLIESGLPAGEAETGMMLALEWNYVTKIDFEARLQKSSLSERYQSEVLNLQAAKDSLTRQRLRRKLLNKLIKDYAGTTQKEIYESVLHLGDPLSPLDSIAVHQWLAQRSQSQNLRFRTTSFVDQAVSVGFAGGVLLYSLNEWAYQF